MGKSTTSDDEFIEGFRRIWVDAPLNKPGAYLISAQMAKAGPPMDGGVERFLGGFESRLGDIPQGGDSKRLGGLFTVGPALRVFSPGELVFDVGIENQSLRLRETQADQ